MSTVGESDAHMSNVESRRTEQPGKPTRARNRRAVPLRAVLSVAIAVLVVVAGLAPPGARAAGGS